MSTAEASKKFKRAEKRGGERAIPSSQIFIIKGAGYRAASSEDTLCLPAFPNLVRTSRITDTGASSFTVSAPNITSRTFRAGERHL